MCKVCTAGGCCDEGDVPSLLSRKTREGSGQVPILMSRLIQCMQTRPPTDLIEQVDAGDVDAVSLDDVDEVVGSGVTTQGYVRVVDLVLTQDRLDQIQIQLRLGHLPRGIFGLLKQFLLSNLIQE